MSAKIINGLVFRVNMYGHSYLVETSEVDVDRDLAELCARLGRKGEVIQSVTRVYDDSTRTPRIAVLTTPEYKQAMKDLESGELALDPDEGPYIALIRSGAVRDAQVCSSEDTDLLAGDWLDYKEAEVYVGVFPGTAQEALRKAAEYAGVVPENIKLIPVAEELYRLKG